MVGPLHRKLPWSRGWEEVSRSSRRTRGAQACQSGAGGVTEQGSRRRDSGVAEALAVGSKAGHVSWDQIAKDPDHPTKAWGLHPAGREWA